ncbi:MAG: hypothetical protein KA473_09320 [Anaerolineales bacterium]|nr:hypothetical protein [Anaerolineales bacterium]MBP6209629.1 hypothetical protein [Anaerolineales bacterium]
MSASLGLFRLQQVDSKIDRARTKLEAIRQALENDAELREALKRAETTKAEHDRVNQILKNSEAEVKAQSIKIQQTEASLYSGSVKNPKELQDLQKEIASLKKHLITLEERELEAMVNAEQSEMEMETAKTALEILQARLGNEHQKMIADQTALTLEVERLTEERGAVLGPIDAALLQIYDDLRQQKRGVAVTEVTDNSCSSCGATLNAALQQSARSSKLMNCPSCGRILYSN